MASDPVPTQQRLSFEDISRLHERQEQIKRANSEYLGQHPELKNLIADFTAAILMQKPDDVFKFARDHFSVFLKDSKPMDSTAVYYGKHIISERRYEVVITTTKDRSKWLVVACKDLTPGNPALTASFSTSELMARFAMTKADADQAALQLSRCLQADRSSVVITKDSNSSPTVEEYDATVKIQAIGRARQQRQKIKLQQEQAEAAKKIQSQHRRRSSHKRVEEIKASNLAATQIQAVYRGKQQRNVSKKAP